MKNQLIIIIILITTSPLFGQVKYSNLWTDHSPSTIQLQSNNQKQMPNAFRLLELNATVLDNKINTALNSEICLEIPLPDGSFECFQIESSSIMHPELAAKFPNIKTYSGQSEQNLTSNMRFVWTSEEFHAIAFTMQGAVLIDKIPNSSSTSLYGCYFAKDMPTAEFTCNALDNQDHHSDSFLKKKMSK